jgi:hypothetical protein
MDHRFTWPDEQLDRFTIGIDQARLFMLVAQVQADDKLDVFNIQNFHQLFVTKLPI